MVETDILSIVCCGVVLILLVRIFWKRESKDHHYTPKEITPLQAANPFPVLSYQNPYNSAGHGLPLCAPIGKLVKFGGDLKPSREDQGRETQHLRAFIARKGTYNYKGKTYLVDYRIYENRKKNHWE